MARNKLIIGISICSMLIGSAIAIEGCARKTGDEQHAKARYHCPMHPTYISDKPGDCPICGMKLVKVESKTEEKAKGIDGRATSPKPAEEKTLEEVCIEHNCTMKSCPMMVKTKIRPGERMICPVCGEVIATSNGKVVEIIKQPQPITAGPEVKGPEKSKQRKVLYYRNPMNPSATSPVPMKDSMGMDYAPVYEEETPRLGASTVMISPEKQQLIGVRTEPVKIIDLKKIIRASGKIAYDPELVVTQEEFIQAVKNEENVKDSPIEDVIDRARQLTEAAHKKLRLLGMSEEQIADLKKTKRAQTNLYLPGKGESVWAYVAIYEYEIGFVKSGQPVTIETTAYPGETFSGKIVSINPVLDAATRTNQVRVEVENPENKLKPEMFVNARIVTDLGEKPAVPESAVIDTGLRKIVYLSEPGDTLESREVTLGQKAEGYYEVLSGLSEGDVVVTSGNFLVDSESKLKGASQ